MIDVEIWLWRVRFAWHVARTIHCGWLCAWRFAWQAAQTGEVDLDEHPREAAIEELRAGIECRE